MPGAPAALPPALPTREHSVTRSLLDLRPALSSLFSASFLAFLLVLLFGAAPAAGHNPGLSAATVRIGDARLDAVLRFDVADLPSAPEARARLLAAPLQLLRTGHPSAAFAANPPVVEGDHVRVSASLKLSAPLAGSLRVRSTAMGKLPHGHRQYLRLEDASGEAVADAVLSAADPELVVTMGAASPHPVTRFVRLGTLHILEGWDHLLFLLLMILSCGRVSRMLAVITVFTVAHSLTLAASTLGQVQAPAWIVESAIAATIVWAGLRNLGARPNTGRERLATTFGFGLVHGLGFAGELAGITGADDPGRWTALLGFNLGVELGQLALAGVALPLLWCARHSSTFTRFGPATLSLAAVCLGLSWLLERSVVG